MYATYKMLRGTIKAIGSDAAPWQIVTGTMLGTLIGFLPLWPMFSGHGPCVIGFVLLFLAIIINCHLGSLFLFMFVTKVLMLVLRGPSLLIGDQFKGLAQTCADNAILYNSLCSNTGYLGRTILGVCFAPLFAIVMYRVVVWARTYLMPKMLAQRKLVTAGKVADKKWMIMVACWFFGV